jgi:hypothetical protein
MSSPTVHVAPFSQFARELHELVDHLAFLNNNAYVILVILAMVYCQVKWILSSYTAKLAKDRLALERLENEVGLHLQSQEVRFATFQEEIVKTQGIHEDDITNMLHTLQKDVVKSQEGHKQETMKVQNDVLKRLSLLEGLFQGLATSEHELNSATAGRLRQQLNTGGLWGKQLKDLLEQSKAADERERAWLKAVAYSPV